MPSGRPIMIGLRPRTAAGRDGRRCARSRRKFAIREFDDAGIPAKRRNETNGKKPNDLNGA
jgi:hypothetical protein